MFDHPRTPIARGWPSKGEDAAKSGHVQSTARSVPPDNRQSGPSFSANNSRNFLPKMPNAAMYLFCIGREFEHTILGVTLVLLPPARYVIRIKPRTFRIQHTAYGGFHDVADRRNRPGFRS